MSQQCCTVASSHLAPLNLLHKRQHHRGRKKPPRLPAAATQGSMDALHTYKTQERVCWPAKAHRLPQSPRLLSLWGVLMLCMHPCRGEPRSCPSPDYGDPHPSEGCCQPGTPWPLRSMRWELGRSWLRGGEHGGTALCCCRQQRLHRKLSCLKGRGVQKPSELGDS